MLLLNEVILAGTIARDSEISCTDNGAQVARTALCLAEENAGQVWKTYVPIEAWSKNAEVLGELSKDTTVLVKGKLKWKAGDKDKQKPGSLMVTVWNIQVVQHAGVEASV
jgi:single-stranded DNA-binding protein